MPKYTYQPLNKPDSEIRLLQISKDPLTHQPQCTLQKYSLIDCPAYTALSYTWGEPTPTHSVAVDRSDLEVRQNLFDFLHSYTTESWGMDDVERPVFYWIDQICINQDDPLERSEQVGIMNKIYRQAKIVRVWLGCDPTMIELVRRLRDAKSYHGYLYVLSESYFSRIWICQEIALSVESPLIVCGGIQLNWDDVIAASGYTCFISPWILRTIYEGVRVQEWRTLEGCVSAHCESNCHDPRDKVYALLGLTPERWRVRVDYSKEVVEVYFDAMTALFEELFDISDPQCLYPKERTDRADPWDYLKTLHTLARAMGFSQRQLNGLYSFLQFCLNIYLSTKIRNVQYTYTGRIYTRARAQPSSERIHAPAEEEEEEEEEEEIEVSWGSMIATRRNPLLRDIIPEIGLQLASTTAENTAEQSGHFVPVLDRWWCKHDGEIHYFECHPAGANSPRMRNREKLFGQSLR